MYKNIPPKGGDGAMKICNISYYQDFLFPIFFS